VYPWELEKLGLIRRNKNASEIPTDDNQPKFVTRIFKGNILGSDIMERSANKRSQSDQKTKRDEENQRSSAICRRKG